MLTKNRLGYILGHFFPNSSSHTDGSWTSLTSNQGDQIGRIFAHWAVVYFGHFLKLT
jgi:hypothetical protein